MNYLNEGLFEQDNWTYLIIEQKEHVNFFNNGYFSPNDYYKDDIDDNKFLLVNTNKNINSSQGQEFIKNQWKRKFGTSPQSVRCILSSNGSIEHAKYIKKIAKAIDLGKVTLKDVMNMCAEYDGHWENKVPYVYGKIFYISIKENKNTIKDMRKNNDRILLESLVKKYGKNGVNLAINRLNENNENPKSGIFIEYHDHISCDAFRILVLDNGVNVLKSDPLEVEVMSTYTGKRYITKLEPKYNNDYIEVDFVHSYSGDLCLVKAIKELHAKYSNLPIYCFTEGFYTFRGKYENVQKLFNDIFSKYLRGISFEFIPGTMREFLKININESLNENFGQTINGIQNTTIEDYEHYWNVNIEVVYFNKDNNKCAIYMWMPEDEIVDEIPEALLEDGIVFERNGMNYWFEPNPSDCYLTHNGTCISLGGYAYPEY